MDWMIEKKIVFDFDKELSSPLFLLQLDLESICLGSMFRVTNQALGSTNPVFVRSCCWCMAGIHTKDNIWKLCCVFQNRDSIQLNL